MSEEGTPGKGAPENESGAARLLAAEFIDVNSRRRELDDREKVLREQLIALFAESDFSEIATDRGTVVCSLVVKTAYDVDKLRSALPAAMWQLVTRIVINEKLLDALAKRGAVDPRLVEQAATKEVSYRLSVRADGDRDGGRKKAPSGRN